MDETIHAALAGWEDFYLITGTAAAALTGLQFVVQSLLASDLRPAVDSGDPAGGVEAFGTPTVVHFTLALVLSAVMCVPWPAFGALRATLAPIAAAALVYAAIVLRKARRQRTYTPVLEDWIWHAVLPAAAYAAVLISALLPGAVPGRLFLPAAATLLLLCVGIHNAWDSVAYLTVRALRSSAATGEHAPRRRRNRR